MKKIKFYNVNWDTDGKYNNLPTEVLLKVDEDIDVSLEGADLLSDEYGFCVNSFNFQEL